MKLKYPAVNSPIKVGKYVLKNRLIAANSLPHFLQGPEPFPADGVITHYMNKAKGAAVVTCMGINNFSRGVQLPMEFDFGHFPDFDLYDTTCQNYLLQLSDAIHYYDSIAAMSLFVGPPSCYPLMRKKNPDLVQGDVNGDTGDAAKPFDVPQLDEFEIEKIDAHLLPHEYDEETLYKIADSYAEQASILKFLGFDMLNLHFAYRANLPGKFMSPLANKRTDKWGGSLENRMRFPLLVLEKIRERVGRDMILEMLWSGEDAPGGYTLQDTVAFLEEAKQYIDIVQLRASDADPNHPTGFNPEETPFLRYAEYVKARVPGLLVSSIGGFQDLDTCERAIAEGKTDLIAMARAFISNPDYAQLVVEGRNDDVVPCLRCNKCHGRGEHDPFVSMCSVNPVIGLEHRIDKMVTPPRESQKVAVIGGGPAGMKCAMDLHDRGHRVTLFEARGELGGAIRHADYASFKWPLKKFKDYLIHQIAKRDIDLRMNTRATPALIAGEGFDIVVAALGAQPAVPPIPGLRETPVVFAQEAFANPDALGDNIVVIGGGEVGVEIGMHLAEHGHRATVLEMRDQLAADTTKIHYRSMFQEAWENLDHFTGVTGARVTGVDKGAVTYTDSDGTSHTLEADTIVVSAGMQPLSDEALTFTDLGLEFYMIGDCKKPATIHEAMRTAFAMAHRV